MTSKEQSIRDTLKQIGPRKFAFMISQDGLRNFGGLEGLRTAKAVYNEQYKLSQNVFMHGVASYLSKSDEVDEDGSIAKKDKADFGESEQGLQPPTIADVNDDANIDKNRDNVGVDIIIPPYNKDASPETSKPADPDGKAPYDVPSKEDGRPKETVTASISKWFSNYREGK